MTLTGPDASHHNGSIDWAQVKAAGHSYAFVKATEGTAYSHVDWFHLNWPQLKMSGLVPGVYHFLRSDFDPAAQARYFVATVGSFAGALAVVDVETGTHGSTPTDVHTRAFATEFHRLVPGHPLLVYTGRWYWRDTIGNPTGVDIGPLWHSAYSTTPGAMYGGWPACTFWQHTSSGACPGISGQCDLNEFHGGGMTQLLALTGSQEADVLDADDKKFLQDLVQTTAKQHAQFDQGRTNALFDPRAAGNEWMQTAVSMAALLSQCDISSDESVKQLGNFLQGKTNSLFDPSKPGNEWMDDAVSLPDLKIDPEALALAIVANLPPGTAVDPVALAEALTVALGDVLPSVRLSVAEDT